MLLPRYSWPDNFPAVVIHTTVRKRDAHPAYAAAKSGDAGAAISLAQGLLDTAAIEALGALTSGRNAVLLPIVADETTGFNAIPDAMAQVLGRILKLPVTSGDVVQTNKVGHTRAPAFQRLVTPAEFDGPVDRGADYVLDDDHVGLGGTLANLRGFLCSRGANVIAMTTLTESREARRISLRPETLNLLWSRHGQPLDALWKEQFGYGLDALTEVEAAQLCRQHSITGIENFLAQAAVEAHRRGLDPTA